MRSLLTTIRGSRFARDSTILQAGSIMLAILGLVGVLALSHILGSVKQGEYYLAVAVFTAVWFALNLGVSAVATSKVASATKDGRQDDVRDWLAFAVEATLLMGVLCALLCWFLVPDLLSWWLGENALHSDRVAQYATLLALEPLVGLPKLVASVGFQGQRRMGSLTRLENSCELTRVIFVVFGAFWMGSVQGAILGQLFAAVIGCLFAAYYYAKEREYTPGLPKLFSVWKRVGHVRLAGRWGLGVRMGLVRNIDAYSVQVLPSLFIDRYGTTEWVAYLRIGQRIVGVLRMVVSGVGRTGVAALSQAFSDSESRRFGQVYRQTTALGGICTFVGSLILLPILPWFLARFMPQDYVDPVWTCVLILIPGMWIMGFSVVNDVFYLLSSQLRVGIWISVCNFAVQIPVLFWLAQAWPEEGVAVALSLTYATSLSHVLFALWWLSRNADSLKLPNSEPLSPAGGQS